MERKPEDQRLLTLALAVGVHAAIFIALPILAFLLLRWLGDFLGWD